jgi:ribose transport system permease protein
MAVTTTPTVRPTRPFGLRSLGNGPVQLLTVAAIFAIGSVAIPGFAEPSSVRAMLVLASFLGIAAIGQTLVVLIGGIDLSVPAVIGAGNVLAARLSGDGLPSPVMFLVVLGAGALVGAVNGFVTSRWRVPPLVVTLATGSVVGGGVLLWTNATLTGSAPAWLSSFSSAGSGTGPLPVAPVVVLWLVLALAAELLLRRSRTGRQLYALGVNRTSARLMLVSEPTITTLAFACSGLTSALAGLLLAGFTGAGLFTVGDPYLFLAIAAVVVGGTSLLGGRGGILRSLLGSLALIELTTLLIGFSLTAPAQQAVLGAVIVLVVALYGRERALGERI